MAPHLLRCQWIRVGHYTLNIGRLEAGAPSTFAHLGYKSGFLPAHFIMVNEIIICGHQFPQ